MKFEPKVVMHLQYLNEQEVTQSIAQKPSESHLLTSAGYGTACERQEARKNLAARAQVVLRLFVYGLFECGVHSSGFAGDVMFVWLCFF